MEIILAIVMVVPSYYALLSFMGIIDVEFEVAMMRSMLGSIIAVCIVMIFAIALS
jgi:hypothetical protein